MGADGRAISSGPPDDEIDLAGELFEGDREIDLDGRASTPEERRRARRIVAWLRGIAPRLAEDDAAQALVEVAEQAGALGHGAEALEAAREAFRRDPMQLSVARAYRVAALRAGEERDVCAALEGEARTTQSPAWRVALETERGLRLERLHDSDKAARIAYARSLDAPGVSVLGLASLERLASRDGSHRVAASYAKQLAEATNDETVRAEHLARAARHLQRAGDGDEVRQLLTAALLDEPRSPLVGLVVEQAALHRGFGDLVEVRSCQIEEGSVDPAEGWFDVGVIARYRLGDDGRAIEAFEKAMAAAEGSADKRACCAELLPLYREARRFEDAIGCARVLCESASGERLAILLTLIGTLLLESLGDEGEALAAFERALEVAPSHTGALGGAGRIHQQRGDTRALVAMHRRAAEAADDPRDRAAALRRAGELSIGREATRGEGIALLREALAVVPADPAAFDALEEALEASGRFEELADLYDEALTDGRLDPARRAFVLARQAQIAAERLDDRARLVAALRALRDAPGGHPPAPLLAALARLEATDDLEGQAEALARIAEQTASPALAAATLTRLAEVQELRGLVDEAVAVLRRAIALAPPGHAALSRAGRAFMRLERYDDLLRLLEEGAREGSDAERARWLEKMAGVLDRRLGRTDEAIAALERARALAPRSASVIAALEEILIRRRRWDGLSALTDGPALRRAVLAEATGNEAAAVAAYRQALDDGVGIARLAYLRALVLTGRWEERMRHELAASPRRVGALCRAAACALELGDRAAAARHLASAAEVAPSSICPRVSMIVLADVLGPEEAAQLAALEDLTTDPALALAALRLHASVLEGCGRDAVAVHERVLRRVPADPIALPAVALALAQRGDRVELAARLKAALADDGLDRGLRPALAGQLGDALEQLGQQREALAVLEIAAAGTPVRRTAWLARHRIARALEDDALCRRALHALASLPPDGPERAICLRLLAAEAPREEALAEALRAHPRDYEALRELRRRLRGGDHEAYTEALTRAFEVEEDEAILVPLGNALAAQWLRDGRLDRARTVCERVLAIAPDSLAAWMLSAEIYERRHAFTHALDALQRVAAHSSAEPRIVLEALRRVARVAVERLRDPATARVALTQVDQLASDRIGLGVRLEIELGLDDRVAAAATLAQLATHSDADEDERSEHLLRLAALKDDLGETAAAMKALGRVRSARRRRDVVERLFVLATRSGDWKTGCKSIARALDEGGDDPRWEAAMRARLARILRDELGREDDALAQEERIARLGASDPASLERLAGAVGERDPERAIGYHRQILAHEPMRVGSYRAIRGFAQRAGDEALTFFAEAALEGLGQATEEESYFYMQRRSHHSAAVRQLDDDALQLLHPALADAGARVLRAVDGELSAVLQVDLTRYGAEGAISGALRESAAAMATLFGVRHRVRIGPSQIAPAVEPGDEPTLVLPRSLGDALAGEQRFVCAVLLARVAFGAVAADHGRLDALSDHHLGSLLEAARRLGRGEAPEPDPVGRDLHLRLDRVLSESARRRLGAIAPEERLDATALRRGLLEATARAGLIGAGDPALAARLCRRYPGMFGGDESATRAVGAALSFAVSEELAALRARFGEGRG